MEPMKRLCSLALILALFLTGCGVGASELDEAMAIREKLLKASGCSFDAAVTADYGDKIFGFRLRCQGDGAGNLTFTVLEPESIAGISGTVSGSSGALTFDGTALSFPLMADGQVTPVTAPWLFLKTLRGGYITSAGREGESLRMAIGDSYQDDALHLDIWAEEGTPTRGEILYDGRKILSVDVADFQFLS